jgi:hypothetical protein
VNPLTVPAAAPRRRIRARSSRRAAIGLVGVAALGLVACAPSNVPTSYDDVAKSSFLQACSGDAPEFQGTTTTLAGSAYCGCAYDVFVQNVPYDQADKDNRRDDAGNLVFANYSGKTYLEYNTELKNDPNILAGDIVEKLNDCKSTPEVIETTAGSTPGNGSTPVDPSTPEGTTPGTEPEPS